MIRAQTFRFAKYRLGKKNKMTTIKCKCASCSLLVEKWIEDKCVRCYHDTIIQPVVIKYDRLLLQESAAHLAELSHQREVELENNRFWSSYVESYRNRLEVRLVDKIKTSAWYVKSLFWDFIDFLRFFVIGGRNLIQRPSKK